MTTYNGITLRSNSIPYIVTAISPTQHFYTDTALSSAVTLPATITTTTTWYCAAAYAGMAYTFTVSQFDGSDISPGTLTVGTTDDTFLRPEPNRAQVAADATPLLGRLASGFYYYTMSCTAVTTVAATVGSLWLHPFVVPNDCEISKIGAEVTGAGGAGSVFRIGIYADNGSGYPGALVLDAGTIDGTSATVQDITLGANQALSRGLYWIGGAAQVGTQPTMRTGNIPAMPRIPIRTGTATPGAGASYAGYAQTGVTGALPATFTTTTVAASQVPRCHLKVV